MTNEQIEALVAWGTAREVSTKFGVRMLRVGEIGETFWAAWRAHKDELKAAGVSCKPAWNRSGVWEANWWMELPKEIVTERTATAAESRALDAEIDIPVPEGLAYMPFQRAGIAWAMKRPNTIIGDEMGLGKTIQAIGVINSDDGIRSILVVAPKTAVGNWFRELNKWLVDRSRTIGIATGRTFPSTDIVLINWDVLTKWPKRLTNFWDLIVLDEAQMMKNWKAKRAQAIIGLKPNKKQRAAGVLPTTPLNARRKLVLTGTPIDNRPDELWPMLHFLDHAKWSSYWAFAKKYCGTNQMQVAYTPKPSGISTAFADPHRQQVVATITQIGNGQNLDRLQRELREGGWMIRRLKKDVLTELPDKTRVIVELDVDDTCQAALDHEKEAMGEWQHGIDEAADEVEMALADENPKTFEEAVKRLGECRRIPFDEIAKVRHDTAVAKLGQVMEALDERIEQKGPKIIVFGHHQDVLQPLLNRYPNAVMIDGQTPAADRDKIVHRFQNDPECGPFIGSIRACGFAITLTASSHVVFVEEDWTPGKISQAEDRAHRIGQKSNVLVEHLILPGSIDAKMAKTHVRKQAIADAALDDVTAMLVRSETVLPTSRDGASMTRRQMDDDAAKMTPEVISAVYNGLRILAGVCDGARQRDMSGFNGCDARIGHSLANQLFLTARQAVLGRKILIKYRRQLPESIYDVVKQSLPPGGRPGNSTPHQDGEAPGALAEATMAGTHGFNPAHGE